MTVGIRRTIYDRKTGKKKSSEIVEILNMSDDEYYLPLVEMIVDDPKFQAMWRGEQHDQAVS